MVQTVGQMVVVAVLRLQAELVGNNSFTRKINFSLFPQAISFNV